MKVTLNICPSSDGSNLLSQEKHRHSGEFDRCHPYLVLLVLCFHILPVAAVADQFVEIKGEIEMTSDPDGNTNNPPSSSSPQSITFVCVSGPKAWSVEHDAPESKWSFDGTNVYNRLGFQAPTIHIWESHDGHPMGSQAVNLVWLAFCSGDYLNREGRLIPLPVDSLRHTPDRFAYTNKTESFTDAPVCRAGLISSLQNRFIKRPQMNFMGIRFVADGIGNMRRMLLPSSRTASSPSITPSPNQPTSWGGGCR